MPIKNLKRLLGVSLGSPVIIPVFSTNNFVLCYVLAIRNMTITNEIAANSVLKLSYYRYRIIIEGMDLLVLQFISSEFSGSDSLSSNLE